MSLGNASPGAPSQIKMDLLSPGFSLYFGDGIDLKLSSTGAPFLSWPAGSVGQTVPTPAGPWVLVSFRTDQPPVLLSFVDEQASMVVDGDSGNWHLRSQGPFKGWVRFLLPLGETGADPVTASGLGQLTQSVSENQDLWSGAAPAVIDTHVESDATSVTATWTFDKPGALVPGAALLAGYGGDSIQITSQIMQLDGSTEDGPIAVTKESRLSIRFLMRPWPHCRYLSSGETSTMPFQGLLDASGAATVAFEALSADADAKLLTDSGSELMAFLGGAHGAAEPYTGLRLSYGADGKGYDLTAAQALLTQALSVSNGSPDLPNPLLAEVLARVDAYTWRPWGVDENSWRRASALAAVALAMRPENDDRLKAAMLQAGLSAERGLDLWRHWQGSQIKAAPRLETLEGLRRKIFTLKGTASSDPLADLLFSPVRSCSLLALQSKCEEGKTLLTWMSLAAEPADLTLECESNLKFGASQNLSSIRVDHHGYTWTVHFTPKAAGACALEMTLPPGAAAIPPAGVPVFVEASR